MLQPSCGAARMISVGLCLVPEHTQSGLRSMRRPPERKDSHPVQADVNEKREGIRGGRTVRYDGNIFEF